MPNDFSTRTRHRISSVVLLPREGGDALWNLNLHDRRASLPMDPYLLELQSLWLAASEKSSSMMASAATVGAEPLANVARATPPGPLSRDVPYTASLLDCGQTAVFADSGVLLVVVFVEPCVTSSAREATAAGFSNIVSGAVPTFVTSICKATRDVFCGSDGKIEVKELASPKHVSQIGLAILAMLGPTGRCVGAPLAELE